MACSPDLGLLDFEAVLGQALGERLPQGRFVFDEQEMLLAQPFTRASRF